MRSKGHEEPHGNASIFLMRTSLTLSEIKNFVQTNPFYEDDYPCTPLYYLKGLPFNQVHVLPHSNDAYEHHLFGFLPTPLTDSRRNRASGLCVLSVGDGSVLVIEEQMWEFVRVRHS